METEFLVSDYDDESHSAWPWSGLFEKPKKKFVAKSIDKDPFGNEISSAQLIQMNNEAFVYIKMIEPDDHPNVKWFDSISKLTERVDLFGAFLKKKKTYWRSLYVQYPYYTLKILSQVYVHMDKQASTKRIRRQLKSFSNSVSIDESTILQLLFKKVPSLKIDNLGFKGEDFELLSSLNFSLQAVFSSKHSTLPMEVETQCQVQFSSAQFLLELMLLNNRHWKFIIVKKYGILWDPKFDNPYYFRLLLRLFPFYFLNFVYNGFEVNKKHFSDPTVLQIYIWTLQNQVDDEKFEILPFNEIKFGPNGETITQLRIMEMKIDSDVFELEFELETAWIKSQLRTAEVFSQSSVSSSRILASWCVSNYSNDFKSSSYWSILYNICPKVVLQNILNNPEFKYPISSHSMVVDQLRLQINKQEEFNMAIKTTLREISDIKNKI